MNHLQESSIRCFASLLTAALMTLFAAGCVSNSGKIPAEDLDVLTVCSEEIKTLQSADYPPNSREKYEAAVSLHRKVDFNYIRRVETLDAIFSSRDARVDNPRSLRQVLNFYYQYGNHSIRLVFHRYKNLIFRFEVIEN